MGLVSSVTDLGNVSTSNRQVAQTEQVSDSFKEAFQNAYGKSQTESMDDIFEEASSRYGVSVNLLKAVAKAESNFNPKAVSKAGLLA